MKEIIKSAFKTTNDNIILTIPLVIFMWIMGAYLAYSQYTANSFWELMLVLVTTLCMLGAFLSGWFYMVKGAVALSKKVFVMDEDRSKAVLGLFKEIPTGIGSYFLSYIGMSFMAIVIFSIFAFLIYKIGILCIGRVDFNAIQLKQALGSPNDIKMLLDSLTEAQLIKLSNWNMLFIFSGAILSYLTFLWVPEVIYSTINPFSALFKSVKKIFKKPLKTFELFMLIGCSNIVLSFLSTFAIYNPLAYLIMMIIYFYFLVFIVVLLFTYYEKEF